MNPHSLGVNNKIIENTYIAFTRDNILFEAQHTHFLIECLLVFEVGTFIYPHFWYKETVT